MPFGEVDLADGGIERCAQRTAAHRRHDIHRRTGAQQAMGELDRRLPVRPVAQVGQEESDGEWSGGERRQRTGPKIC